MAMSMESVQKFVEEFNNSNKTIGDFMKSAKLTGISIEALGEPIEIDNGCSWTIHQIGELRQCNDCKAIEFIKIGHKPKNSCA